MSKRTAWSHQAQRAKHEAAYDRRLQTNEYKGCMTKRSYDSKHLAKEVAERRSDETGTTLRVYHCHYCHKFHLTSNTERK